MNFLRTHIAFTVLLEFPLMVSNAYVVRSCGKIDNSTIILHGTHFFVLLLIPLLLACIFGLEDVSIWAVLAASVLLPLYEYGMVYMKLANQPYNFEISVVGKLGSDVAEGGVLLVYLGTIGWGMWCVLFGLLPFILCFAIYKCCRTFC